MHVGDECGGNIFYDLDTLANRALLIQDIDYPPFDLQDESPKLMGYIYIFPNITFTENGSIFLWRFGARIVNSLGQENTVEYPRLQVWRMSEDGGYRLVSSSENSQEPSLEPGALNVYRYDVDLTYQAGDVLAVYQPMATRTKYSLAFVNSSNYTEPNVVYEGGIPILDDPLLVRLAGFAFREAAARRQLVEPVMSILSTSMPNDTEITVIFPRLPDFPTSQSTEVTGRTPFQTTDSATATGLDTVNTVPIEQNLVPTVIGTVVGGAILIVLLIIAILLLAIFLSQRRYRIAKQELANESNPAHPGTYSVSECVYCIIMVQWNLSIVVTVF